MAFPVSLLIVTLLSTTLQTRQVFRPTGTWRKGIGGVNAADLEKGRRPRNGTLLRPEMNFTGSAAFGSKLRRFIRSHRTTPAPPFSPDASARSNVWPVLCCSRRAMECSQSDFPDTHD